MQNNEKPIRYGKPSITNLPYELGKSIIETIKNSPPTNEKKIQRNVKKVENNIKKVWG